MMLNMIQAINLSLKQEMERDQNVVVFGEDVGKVGGVFRATEGLQQMFGEKRVFDTPLSELGIVSTAVGMAAYGLKPIAEIQFSGFLFAAFEHLYSHAARIRTRSRGRYTAPLVVRAPHFGGIHALELHSEGTEAVFVHTPGLKVVIPATPYDAKGLLASAVRDPDPVIFLEAMKLYRAYKEEVPEEEYTIPLGKAKVMKEGSNVSIFSYGVMAHVALKAAEEAKAKGIDCEVIDLRTLSPLDIDAILNSVKKTGRAVVVHEGPKRCGMGAEIAALINEKAMLSLEAPVVRVTGPDVPYPLYKMEKLYLPNIKRILLGIEKVSAF